MTELNETIDMMIDNDYKKRFIAEYWQTKIRYEKLKDFCNKIEVGENFNIHPIPKHDCPLFLLREQQKIMGELLHLFELRALIEKIDLNQPIKSKDTVFEEL